VCTNQSARGAQLLVRSGTGSSLAPLRHAAQTMSAMHASASLAHPAGTSRVVDGVATVGALVGACVQQQRFVCGAMCRVRKVARVLALLHTTTLCIQHLMWNFEHTCECRVHVRPRSLLRYDAHAFKSIDNKLSTHCSWYIGAFSS
jgi:hypothetical protein